MLTGVRSFAPELASVPAARRFLRETLAGWDAGHWEWKASQVLTELATNAVIHAHTEFTVEVTFTDPTLKICIADGSLRPPTQRRHSDQATTGRGLTVVETLAESWGLDTRPNGKTVWCVILAGAGDDLLAGFDTAAYDLGPDQPDDPEPSAIESSTQLCAA